MRIVSPFPNANFPSVRHLSKCLNSNYIVLLLVMHMHLHHDVYALPTLLVSTLFFLS